MQEIGDRCITVREEFKNVDPVTRHRYKEIGSSINFLDRHILANHLHEELRV
jgi:hypothetical protein